MTNEIYVKGASENNLKHIDCHIPRDKFVVITGISGSGKSSLAFDTIYAEGQRRYIESLSSYARQFLGQMDKPKVEAITGLSPAISIDQKTTAKNPRSTVGTVTEIHDYLRLLYARIGIPHCPVCGREIRSQSVDMIVNNILDFPEGTRLIVLAPLVRERKGEHEKILARIRREGFTRARIDGKILDLGESDIKLEKTYKHSIEIVVDRIIIREDQRSRIAEAVELAIRESGGLVIGSFQDQDYQSETMYSTKLACPDHGISIEELEPRSFSFNSPFGACPACNGLGFTQKIREESIIQEDKSIQEGALSLIFACMEYTGYYWRIIDVLADRYGADLTAPFRDQPAPFKKDLLYGTGRRHLKYTYRSVRGGKEQKRDHPFEGLLINLERRYRETGSEFLKERLSRYMTISQCPACHGKRLRPEVLAVTVGGKNIADLSDMSVRDAFQFIREIKLSDHERMIADQIVREIRTRLSFLINVGLDYLTLSRASATLSGGESQRIRLATQIGSALVGVCYILDEPSIGLHQKDNRKLLATLRQLTDLGNTLLVVEHDEETMYEADHIIDIGPGAGIYGGELVAEGTVEDIKKEPRSITGQYLSGKKKIRLPESRRKGNGSSIVVRGARANNLKNIDVTFPLGTFTCVTGVSGSGKSSLTNEILAKAASEVAAGQGGESPLACDRVEGLEAIDKVIDIDQSPIGRTPRSNPATYTGMFTKIRDLFAELPEAKMRGFGKGRFSFNVKGGRCEACRGDGIIKIEMHFLSDVYVPCDVCHGRRYNQETLEVKYKGKNIYDVLNMSVAEGMDFFRHFPGILRHLKTLNDVGLGYIKIGQPSPQLSGGEAQRVKLATELARRDTGRTLYILDEPTTGLHFADVDKLIQVLQRLVDAGNTVVVIEHNLDVIKCADHIIDLGPDGGDKGGEIVAQGSPEEIAHCRESYTGQYLRRLL